MPGSAHLDVERGIAACGGDAALHRQVVGMLAADLDDRVGALRRSLIAKDLVSAGRMAHKHKGACLSVGAVAMAERFARIDQAARGGDVILAGAELDLLTGEAAAFLLAARELRG
ncbi:MAG: Hpt domain-containing protein [Planctomycetes bacterium]|nr:Hpt domain-containing protein [Planctomycetota bacterium]